MQKIRNIIIVSGSVQGVGFRYSAHAAAFTLGIVGCVTNMPDGTVRIEAEGSRNTVEKFTEWCRKGPSYANVSHIEVEELPPVGHKSFEVIA